MRITKRKTLKSDDINNSIQMLNYKRISGYDSHANVEYETIENFKGLWKQKQNMIDIDDYLSKPIGSCPMQPLLHYHWMVIEGKRPNIPENFIKENYNHEDKNKYLSNYPGNQGLNSNDVNNFILPIQQNSQQLLQSNQSIIHNISKELQIFYDNFEIRFRKEMKQAKVNNEDFYEISKELEISLDAIKNEPGVVELLPYIIEFLMSILKNKQNLKENKIQMLIISTLCCIDASPYFNVPPYLHQIITLILSILLLNVDDKYSQLAILLKDKTAKLLVDIINKYEAYYNDFIDQITFVVSQHLQISENPRLISLYASLSFINELGPKFIESILFSKLEHILLKLQYFKINNSMNSNKFEPINFSQTFDINKFSNLPYNSTFMNEYSSIAGKPSTLNINDNENEENSVILNEQNRLWINKIVEFLKTLCLKVIDYRIDNERQNKDSTKTFEFIIKLFGEEIKTYIQNKKASFNLENNN